MTLLHGPTLTGATEIVVFEWSTHLGYCYECGLPAAFWLPLTVPAYSEKRDEFGIADSQKLCAVCAANAAVEHERIARIQPEENT